MQKFVIVSFLACGALFAQPQLPSEPQPTPITVEERVEWFRHATVGVPTMVAGVIPAGFGTLFNRPKEYGTHWDGFGKRYGIRLTGSSTSNAMEASLGAVWGEDPRYYRLGRGQGFKRRLKNALVQAFVDHDRHGNVMPAYARYMAIPGSNFLSNTWRPGSEANVSGALLRTGLGFLDRAASNLFNEFWVSVHHH